MSYTSYRSVSRRLVVLAVTAAVMLAVAAPAWAETFMVETTNDSGPSSLRQAVADANATAEPDTIVFALDAGATIPLSSTLTVTNPLSIEGHPLRPLTISGNNAVRPFYVQRTALTISDMTIANGRASGATDLDNSGGAILNDESTLNIRDSVLRNNSAARGGAIYARTSKMNIINSTLSGNSATNGGAIYNHHFAVLTSFAGCPAVIANSTLANNSATNGGAIHNSGICRIEVNDTRVENNAASTNGGGIYNDGGLTVRRSSLHGNTANHDGGGIYNIDFATVVSSTFGGNAASTGGGIRNGEFVPSPSGPVATGTMTLERSTFVGNLANRARNLIETGEARSCGYNRGGGLYNEGTATLTGNTFSGNHAEVYRPGSSCIGGDGLGGGIASYYDLRARNNIVAGNTGQVADVTCGCFGNNFVDVGFNIVGGTAEQAGLQTDAGDPVLADNGGPTRTVALVRGGKAVDAGNSFGSTTDQRGTPRPRDYASVENAAGGDGSDIGSFEYLDPDATAPTVEARTSPLLNEGGLNNSDVTVSINASDEEGGSGVWRVSYSASGAQQADEQNVPGNSAELVISAEGETVVTYWATDRAGNVSASRTLTVRLDKTPPETSIGAGPSNLTRSSSARFAFSSPEAGATFECSLDKGTFEVCSSPKVYSNLANGRHTFSVRATDGSGNSDATPAVRAWTVDTIKPAVSGISPKRGSITRDTTPRIRAVVRDDLTNLKKADIKLYVGGKPISPSRYSYSAATDILTYNSPRLAKGKKAVKIGATDAAKNVGTKSWHFTIR